MAFDSPHYYIVIPEDERDNSTWVSHDLCVVEGRDRFIRCTLEIPIHGSEEGFLWGVWLSVSEANFEDYRENFENESHQVRYVGWISNILPCYPNTLQIVGAANLQSNGQRPKIELKPTDHSLYADYLNGIPWERAIDIAQVVMHGHA